MISYLVRMALLRAILIGAEIFAFFRVLFPRYLTTGSSQRDEILSGGRILPNNVLIRFSARSESYFSSYPITEVKN